MRGGKSKKPISPGRCVYGAFLNEKGEVIDDTIIYMLEANSYLAIVNAGMGSMVAEHLNASKGAMNAKITDLTDSVCKIDVQGPMSAKILVKVLTDPEAVFEKMPYFSFKGYFDAASPLADAVTLSFSVISPIAMRPSSVSRRMISLSNASRLVFSTILPLRINLIKSNYFIQIFFIR